MIKEESDIHFSELMLKISATRQKIIGSADVCIVFIHHDYKLRTLQHLESLIQHNPGVPIALIACEDEKGIPGCTYIRKTFTGTNRFNTDWILREWFKGANKIDAERYIIIEWDCLVTIPLREWYQEVWTCDVVGAHLKLPLGSTCSDKKEWCWFERQRHRLPLSIIEHACGLVPMNGLFISRLALEVYARLPESYGSMGVIGEQRLPTTLKAMGFEIESISEEKAKMNDWCPHKELRDAESKKGVWHPIK